MAATYLVACRLVPVSQEWELQRLTINIAYPTRHHRPAKVRCLRTELRVPTLARAAPLSASGTSSARAPERAQAAPMW
jgi:hypothetical protein